LHRFGTCTIRDHSDNRKVGGEPFIMLFDKNSSGKPEEGFRLGEHPDDIGTSLSEARLRMKGISGQSRMNA
jgi:hypothetical protein